MTNERIDDLLAVNVRAPMLLARAALPSMVDRGHGAVVRVSSIAGALLVPRESVYSASKAAVEAFAEPLREELRGTGVTVSTVMPAVVATAFFDDRGEPYARRFPRPQPPERAAHAILRAVERGTERVVVPPWFTLPLRVRGVAPGLYRRLSRRFG
jgi:short-subunit dehydrogenase